MSIFNIKDAVDEIMYALEDKVERKGIRVNVSYIGFDDQYMVKTD